MVVLIIGILAAIALPQYTKAVEKSRVAEAKITLKNLVNAAVVFGLAQPQESPSLAEFDISIPGSYEEYEGFTEAVVGDKWAYYVAETYYGGSSSLAASSLFCAERIGQFYAVCTAGPGYDNVTLAQGNFTCEGSEANCKAAGAVKSSDGSYYF